MARQMSRQILYCSIMILLLISCEKSPQAVNNAGIISGYARDEQWNELSEVVVSAFGPYGKLSTTTDSEGHYEFNGMGNGSYYLEFGRNDLGIRRLYNIRIFNGESVRADIVLYELPGDFRMPEFKRAYIGTRPRSYPVQKWICLETNVTSVNQKIYNYGFELILFLSRKPDISCEKYDLVFPYWNGMWWDDPITFYIDPPMLPFKTGEEIFVICYAGNKNEDPDQLDPYTGRPEFSSLDRTRHSNVVSFIMP